MKQCDDCDMESAFDEDKICVDCSNNLSECINCRQKVITRNDGSKSLYCETHHPRRDMGD